LKNTKLFLTIVLLLTATVGTRAKDGDTFKATSSEGIEVLYQIISESDKTVRVGAEAVRTSDPSYTQAIDRDITGKLTIPAEVNDYQVVEVGYGAFFWRSGITEVVLPEGLESIENAFYQNSSLRRVNIPSTVTTFKTPFTCCFALEYIDVPEGITEVMQEQFNNTGLKGVHLPSTITSIGSKSFYYANYLSGVFLDAPTPPTLHEEAFPTTYYINYYDSTYVFVPAESVEAYQHADVWSNFQHIRAPYATGDTFTWKDKSGLEFEFLVTSATDRTVQIGTGSRPAISTSYIGNVTIPTYAHGYRVASFAPNAFVGCTGIAAVTANFDYPMAFPASAFPSSLYTNGYLYVPEDLRPRYAALEGWNEFQQVNPGNFAQWETFMAVNPEGIEIAYTVTDAEKKYVEVEDYKNIRQEANTHRALDKNTEGHVTIPDCVLGYKVTEIGREAFMECSKITSVRLPESVISIGHEAFSYCTSMTSINMPSALETIKQWAFWGCSSLTSLDIPHGVTTIEQEAFKGCSGLGDLVLPSTLTTFDASVFIGCTGLKALRVEAGGAFDSRDGCNALIRTATNTLELGTQNTVIPTSVTAIGSNAFAGFKSFTEVDVPAWITSIGSGAYKNCSNVKRVTLHDAVAIDDNAFSNLASDSRVYVFSDNMPTCTSSSFTANSTLYVPIGRRTDYQAATGWSGISTIKEMYPLGTETFTVKTAEDVDLTLKIADPYELTAQVGDGTNVAINAATTGTLTIPATAGDYTCSTIATNAFKDCSGLTEVIISDGINAIESQAFSGNTGLKTVICQATTAYPIADDAFDAATYSNATLSLHINQRDAFAIAEGWKNFTHVRPVLTSDVKSFTEKTIEGIDVTYKVIDFDARSVAVGDGSGTAIATTAEGSLTIPAEVLGFTVVSVSGNAFKDCTALTEISLPDGITNIGNNVMRGCSALHKLRLPKGLTDIGSYAFSRCSALDTLIIPASVKTIGSWANYQMVASAKVFMVSDEPPVCDQYAITGAWDMTLYVPVGTSTTYKAAAEWSSFTNVVEYYPETIETFTATTDDQTEMTFKILDHYHFKAQVGDGIGCAIGNETSSLVIVPSKVGIYDVTGIGTNAFKDCNSMPEISISESVTNIGSWAFSGCTALKAVNCQATAAYPIADDAFDADTYSNATLYVPSSLADAFSSAEGWKLFTQQATLMENGAALTAATVEGVEVTYTIIDAMTKCVMVGGQPGEYSWMSAPAIDKTTSGTVTIPATVEGYKVTAIGDYAFSSCYSITNVIIPVGVKTIGKFAFAWSRITAARIPLGVTTIGNSAFYGCTDFSSVSIPPSVTSIGYSAFNKQTDVAVGARTPYTISSTTFDNRTEATLHVPVGSKEAYEAADYWKEFKEIVEGGDIIYGEDVSTFTIKTVEDVTLTCRITDHYKLEAEVGDGTNTACLLTTEGAITIPEAGAYSLVGIAAQAFNGCDKMTEVSIPGSVGSIGSGAFSGCSALETVRCQATLPYPIPANAFDELTYSTALLLVADLAIEDYAKTDGWKLFVNRGGLLQAGDCFTAPTIEGVEVTYTVKDPVEKTVMVGGQPGEYSWALAPAIDIYTSGVLTIPSEVNGFKVVAIANDAFQFAVAISSIIVPATVTEIGSYAISYCTKLSLLTVEATTPPTVADNTFTNSYGATLCVPFGSRAAYRADANWNQFTTIIETGSGVEGDANNDGQVTITDAVSVVDYILGNPSVDFKAGQADLSGDGDITITDAVGVVDMILNQ